MTTAARRRTHLADGTFPTEIDRRAGHEGVLKYLRELVRALVRRDGEIVRRVNLNATVDELVPDEAGSPAFAGAWLQGSSPVRIWRTAHGMAYAAGVLDRSPRTPSIGETVVTLPAEYAPAAGETGHVLGFVAASPIVAARLEVDDAGVVTWEGPATSFGAECIVQGFWRLAGA